MVACCEVCSSEKGVPSWCEEGSAGAFPAAPTAGDQGERTGIPWGVPGACWSEGVREGEFWEEGEEKVETVRSQVRFGRSTLLPAASFSSRTPATTTDRYTLSLDWLSYQTTGEAAEKALDWERARRT